MLSTTPSSRCMHTTPPSGARKNSQLRSTAVRRPSASSRAIPIAPYTTAPSSRRSCAWDSGSCGTFGGLARASANMAATNRSRAAPVVNTTCHGWTLEFDATHIASARDSSTRCRGTGSGRNIRVERRCRIVSSRSNMTPTVTAGSTPAALSNVGSHEVGNLSRRAAADEALRHPSEVVRVDEVRLRAPIPTPPSIRDSLCFLDHMRNCQRAMGGGRVLKDTWYRIPAFYFACPSTVLGPYDDAPMAPGSVWQDFELEIAAVIGTAGKDLSIADAEQSIVGYMIFNDWSARDLQQLEGQLAIGQAKGKDSGVTLGPYLVTPDELEPYRRDGKLSLEVTALVNDTVIGSGSTAQMDWS